MVCAIHTLYVTLKEAQTMRSLKRTQSFLISFILISLLIGCGQGLHGPQVDQGEFRPYVEQFIEEARKRGHNFGTVLDSLQFEFVELEDPTEWARCQWDPVTGRKILVDPEHWQRLDVYTRTSLIFHELGHGALRRNHKDETLVLERSSAITQSIPESLMNTFVVRGEVFLAHRDHYLDELFK